MQPDLNEEIVAADDAIDAKEDDDPVSSEPSMKDVDLEAENVTSFSETKRLGQLEIKKEVTLDNWRHRSAKMKCCTCMWFVKKDMIVETLDDKHIGRCRKHAPTMDGFPVVFELDWCGDHKLDETKINVEIG